MASFAILGGVGAIVGLVVGTALALVRVRPRWIALSSIALFLPYLLWVLVTVRGCEQPECGENAYPLALLMGAANFVGWNVAGFAAYAVARRLAGGDERAVAGR